MCRKQLSGFFRGEIITITFISKEGEHVIRWSLTPPFGGIWHHCTRSRKQYEEYKFSDVYKDVIIIMIAYIVSRGEHVIR